MELNTNPKSGPESTTNSTSQRAVSVAGKKLAFFIPDLRGGGAERIMVDVVGEMLKRGAEVELIVVREGNAYVNDLDSAVKITNLNCQKTFKALKPLTAYLRSAKPDVFCAFLTHANVISVLARALSGNKHTKLMICPHNNLTMEGKYGLSRGDRQGPTFAKLTYRFADLVVSCGRCVEQNVRTVTGLIREKSTYLPNVFVSQELIERSQTPPEHPWLTEKTVPVFAFFGRLTIQKDPFNLIDAFAKVRQLQPCRLILFGEGPLRESIVARTRELGIEQDVDLPGFTKNPFNKMRAADCVVLSSKYEGLPTVLVQALACGAPIVATDCPCGPDEVLDGGKWGHLVPVEDSESLAKAMGDMLQNPIRPTPESWARFGYARAMDAWESTFAGLADGVLGRTG